MKHALIAVFCLFGTSALADCPAAPDHSDAIDAYEADIA